MKGQKTYIYLFLFLEIKVLEDNKVFSDAIADIQMPTKRQGTLKIGKYSK